MSRSARRRRGRTYQPLPPRRRAATATARVIVLVVGASLLVGTVAFLVAGR